MAMAMATIVFSGFGSLELQSVRRRIRCPLVLKAPCAIEVVLYICPVVSRHQHGLHSFSLHNMRDRHVGLVRCQGCRSLSMGGCSVQRIAAHRGGKAARDGAHGNQGNISLASCEVSRRKAVGRKSTDYAKLLSALLPHVVVATAFAALVQPCTFSWVSKEYYAPALGGIMLSIGVQLTVKDFALALKRPMPVIAGYIAQYGFKPLLGVFVAKVFSIPAMFASGFILMATVAGAQLSSYASYLSEGDVALSIVLTSLSTITSVVVTPLLTRLLIGSVVPVDALAMAKSILQVVLCPVLMGLALNTFAKPWVDRIRPVMPLVAMVCTSMCIGSPIALNRSQIASIQGAQLVLPVITFHVIAFAFGYWLAKLPALRFAENSARTLSLCTGMQSSTLAGLLATQFLGGSQAVPPACSVVVMAVLGLSIASFWGNGNSFLDLCEGIFGASDHREKKYSANMR